MDSTLAQRLRMRKEKPRLSFWDLSGEDSESDKEERPKKKIKPIVNIEESAIQQREQSPPS